VGGKGGEVSGRAAAGAWGLVAELSITVAGLRHGGKAGAAQARCLWDGGGGAGRLGASGCCSRDLQTAWAAVCL
jgi:hypothetical protein